MKGPGFGVRVSSESERVAGFGRLEDGLRQASPWYMGEQQR